MFVVVPLGNYLGLLYFPSPNSLMGFFVDFYHHIVTAIIQSLHSREVKVAYTSSSGFPTLNFNYLGLHITSSSS